MELSDKIKIKYINIPHELASEVKKFIDELPIKVEDNVPPSETTLNLIHKVGTSLTLLPVEREITYSKIENLDPGKYTCRLENYGGQDRLNIEGKKAPSLSLKLFRKPLRN